MTIMTENLNRVFNIQEEDPIGPLEVHETVEESTDSKLLLNHDYETARSNLHNLLEHGQSLLGAAISTARESESARSFEVASNLIKQLADINLQLIDLTKKKRDIETPTVSSGTTVNNNSVFVGSTAELHKLIQETKHKKEGI